MTYFKSARGAFADRFRKEIFFAGEREMNDATLVRIHGPKGEGNIGGSDSISRMSGHRTQFGFARGAKVFDIADDALALWKSSTEGLIDEMLKGFKQLASFAEEQRRVGTLYLQQATRLRFSWGRMQLEPNAIKNSVQKILRLDTCFIHLFETAGPTFPSCMKGKRHACETRVVFNFLGGRAAALFSSGGSSSSSDFVRRLIKNC